MTAFESRPWVLTAGIPFPQDVASVWPSATFEAGTLGGSTGCNRYTGPYTVDGDSLALGRIVAKLEPVSGERTDRGFVVVTGTSTGIGAATALPPSQGGGSTSSPAYGATQTVRHCERRPRRR